MVLRTERVARSIVGLWLGLWLTAAGSVARADGRNPVEKLAADAAVAYHAADYTRAAQLLERAYKLQPVSALLYNLAKAYEKLGEEEKAAELYGRYVADDDADPRLKSKAEARLAALREQVSAPPRRSEPSPTRKSEPAARVEPAAAPPPASPESENGTPGPAAAPKRRAPVEETPRSPAERMEQGARRDRGLALGLGVVGVAALGSAIGLSANALGLQAQFNASLVENDKRATRDAAQGQAIAADVLYAVAAAAVGVGAYFLWRGYHQPARAVAMPFVSPTGGGLVAEARF